MAANTQPIFVLFQAPGLVQVTVANTALDGTGTILFIGQFGVDGGVYYKTRIMVPLENVLADVIRLFWNLTSTGATRLYAEIAVPAGTYSGTVAQPAIEYITTTPEAYSSDFSLYGATHNGQHTNILVLGGSY